MQPLVRFTSKYEIWIIWFICQNFAGLRPGATRNQGLSSYQTIGGCYKLSQEILPKSHEPEGRYLLCQQGLGHVEGLKSTLEKFDLTLNFKLGNKKR